MFGSGTWRQNSRLMVPVLGMLLLALVTGGCRARRADQGRPLVYRLKWLYNISVVGDLYSLEKGFFADQGLQVDIRPGGPERDAITELETGRAQFGVASADQVIRAVAKGSPIVVLAQLFQANPLQWIYRDQRITPGKPSSWRGRVIGITYGGNDETIMRALLRKNHLSEDEVQFFSVRYDLNPFLAGRVDLWPIYRNAEGVIIADKLAGHGEKSGFLSPDAYGIHFVANSVITTRQMLQNHPRTVDRFRRALLQGWRQALDPANGEEAVALVHRYDRDTPPALIRKQLAITRALMIPPAGQSFGHIDVSAWKQTSRLMYDQHLVPMLVDVEQILAGD